MLTGPGCDPFDQCNADADSVAAVRSFLLSLDREGEAQTEFHRLLRLQQENLAGMRAFEGDCGQRQTPHERIFIDAMRFLDTSILICAVSSGPEDLSPDQECDGVRVRAPFD